MQVKKFKFAGGAVLFDDKLPALPAQFRIDPIDFTLSNISTVPKASAEVDFACRINGESALGLKGPFTIEPLAANMNIDLTNLDIRFAQSYMPETLLLDLTSGTLGLKGSVEFKQVKDAAPAILWQGDIRLANFASVRRGDKEDLLKCSSLDLQSMRTGTSPLFLDIKTVKIAGLFMRPVVAGRWHGESNLFER